MNLTAIIFDMDGTLIDSLDVWEAADRTFAHSLGLDYNTAISLAMKKMHFVSACDYLKNYYSLDMSSEEIGGRIMEIIKHSYLHEVSLKPYVYEYISAQHKLGIKMCVATANDKGLAVGALKNLGIYEMLDFVITSDEVGEGKETPLIFKRAAQQLGAAPENTIVFEDSIHALKSAKKGGFFTVGVFDEKFRAEFELLREAADYTITSFEEICRKDFIWN